MRLRWRSLGQRQAFTLVEIMIVVALIGLLAALAIPSFIKVRKQSQGKRIVNDARIIDAAINSWALENGVADGTAVNFTGAATYTKEGVIPTVDILGNPYSFNGVGDSQVMISASSKTALNGVLVRPKCTQVASAYRRACLRVRFRGETLFRSAGTSDAYLLMGFGKHHVFSTQQETQNRLGARHRHWGGPD